MTDGEPRLSPQFADLAHKVREAQEEAFRNLLSMEENVEGPEEARALELEQATFDFNILSAMARPLKMLRLSSQARPAGSNPSSEAIPPPPPEKSTTPRPERKHPTVEKVAEKLLVHLIDGGGQIDRGEHVTAAGRVRRGLGLTDYYLQKGRRDLEARGLLRVEPVPGNPGYVQAYVLEEEALLEAAKREELSHGVLRAIANSRRASTDMPAREALPVAFEAKTTPEPSSVRSPEPESGLSDHLSSQRAQRATAAKSSDQQSISDRQKGNREMGWYVRNLHGELFSATISAKKFSTLEDADKLLLAVTLVRSAKFASIYNDNQKIRGYLLSMVNKGRDKDDIMYVDEEGLQKLIETEIDSGRLDRDDSGPLLGRVGLDHLLAEKKRRKW